MFEKFLILFGIAVLCFFGVLIFFSSNRPAPKQIKEPNKWQLVPDKHGTYTLEKWNTNIEMYICEAVRINSPEEADEIIKNLERPIIS